MLAAVPIEDAITAVIPNKIEQALRLLAKGEAEEGDAKCDNGIEDYEKAWKRAAR